MCIPNRELKSGFFTLLTAILFVFSTIACGQSPEHLRNERYLTEFGSVARNAVLLNNKNGLIPLTKLQDLRIASVSFGARFSTVFDSILNKYAAVTSFSALEYSNNGLSLDDLGEKLKFFNTVIIQVSDQSLQDPRTLPFILEYQKNKRIVLSLSGDVRALSLLGQITSPIIWNEKKTAESADFAAQAIFGGVGIQGKLPQSISTVYQSGQGDTTSPVRLKYTSPEDSGIDVSDLNGIDNVVAMAIRERVAPSITVMVVKDGKVIFDKAYGTHTYTDRTPTGVNDIYDLASITKISATTLAVMRLYEQGKIKLDTNAGAYIPKARKTDKNNISVRELMLHQAGLVSYIPFYSSLSSMDHSADSSEAFPTKVADGYFLRKDYFGEVMWPRMLNSRLNARGTYVYSDLSMYFMREIVERQSGERLQNYVQQEFYRPLGMSRAGFNPRQRFLQDEIIPTENDTYFRKTLLSGYVHDQGAAMAGGVSGHAGLFSSANDLAIVSQMLLNKGMYGGVRYFNPETVDLFSSNQSTVSRRGLGFDRWDPKSKNGYPSKLASPETYGHTGYTGTCVWIDPKYKLIYIFLSNRVNPSVTEKINQLGIRGKIQDVIYEAILKSN